MPTLTTLKAIESGATLDPLVPSDLKKNLLAAYTCRSQGLTDFPVMISSDFTTGEMDAIFGAGNHPTAGEITAMKAYHGADTWVGLEPVVINPYDKYYWPDRSGNNRHIHFVNMAYDATGGLQAGPPANMLFDGVNDYGVYNSPTDIVAANGAVSAFFVINLKTIGSPSNTIRFGRASNSRQALLMYINATGITGQCEDTTSGVSTATQAMTVQANTWYTVAIVYSLSTRKTSISVNGGVFVESATALTNGLTLCDKLILSANAGISTFANVRNSETYIFNKTLTQAEIKSLHNNIASRYGLARV